MSTHKYTHSDAFSIDGMAGGTEQVTVDKAYFDALLRRADFHTRTLGDPARITISRAEYDSLLRESREYELLKNSLFSGGITPETLNLLISGGSDATPQNKPKINAWADEFEGADQYNNPYADSARNDLPWKYPSSTHHPGNGAYLTDHHKLRVPATLPPHRHPSFGGGAPSSVPDDTAYEDCASSFEGTHVPTTTGPTLQRTLYFTNLPPRTTYRDLLSVIRGSKILSINLATGKPSATVTFLSGAAAYLTWTKRNDIYIHSKRIEVRWAERQFKLNQHIANKISNGASRNLCIRGAASHGLTEEKIREDMEHIHNLVIVDITYRNGSGDAYVATNSVHNALFARTCMMSRGTYKGCKIEFYADECDVPIPQPAPRAYAPVVQKQFGQQAVKTGNRFGMLGSGGSNDEENRGPREDDDEEEEDEGLEWKVRGVSLED